MRHLKEIRGEKNRRSLERRKSRGQDTKQDRASLASRGLLTSVLCLVHVLGEFDLIPSEGSKSTNAVIASCEGFFMVGTIDRRCSTNEEE